MIAHRTEQWTTSRQINTWQRKVVDELRLSQARFPTITENFGLRKQSKLNPKLSGNKLRPTIYFKTCYRSLPYDRQWANLP
jgi:hypothetical protein